MARVWITDGSVIPFSDVHRLFATHQTQFGHAVYKGLVDSFVPTGTADVTGELVDDALCPEAEWCIQFPEGIGSYLTGHRRLGIDTPIVMQGLIEGKWLNRLLDTDKWGPATLGNNLLAEGFGISTTFGRIEAGAEEGRIEVSYHYEVNGEQHTRKQYSMLRDLAGQNILGLARDVLRFCRENELAIDAIDLSAVGETAAIFNERQRIRAAARFGLGPIPNPLYFILPRSPLILKDKVVRAILAEGVTVPPGSLISITTYDKDGAVVGTGSLTWQAKPPSSLRCRERNTSINQDQVRTDAI